MLVQGNRRKAITAALVAMAMAGFAAIGLAAPDPAAAIPGLIRVVDESPKNDEPRKEALAPCPDGRVVVGGGAHVREPGSLKRVRLTTLKPGTRTHPFDNYDGEYYAVAEAPGLRRDYEWSLVAFAICAYKVHLRDYTIKEVTTSGSSTFQWVNVRCPSGTLAWGSGARIEAIGPNGGGPIPSGEIGLQLMRTSGPMDIVRATGRESVSGWDDRWRLKAYAICAARSIWSQSYPLGPTTVDSGLHVDNNGSTVTTASARCPDGFRTHGLGGGGGTTDGGPVWLRTVAPHFDLKGVDVGLTGLLRPSIGGMVAHQTCAKF